LDDSAFAWLADKGYDPVYGARPLKRVIQKDLVDPIARKLLAGEIEDGSVIAVSAGFVLVLCLMLLRLLIKSLLNL
ncbi:MAG: hypothetical protein ACOVKC_02640, partial [Brevundimonas sp.]